MNKELEDRIYDAALVAKFGVQFFEDYAFFRGYSPSGEDISFEVYYKDEGTFEDIFDGVLVTFTDFDVDEHAVMWYETHGRSGAPDTRSPTLTLVTPSPTSTTSPENSCPRTIG